MIEGGPNPREMGYYVALGQVGLEMVLPVIAGLGLDHWLGWGPWGAVGGAVLGFVGGLLHLLALLNRQERDRDSSSGPRQDQP